MAVAIDAEGRVVEAGIKESQESRLVPLDREQKWQFKELIEKNIEALLGNTSTPIDLKNRIEQAREESERMRHTPNNYMYEPEILVREDPQRAATSLVNGGAFYAVSYKLPGLNLRFRVKRSGLQDKFEKTRRVQEYLVALQEAGFLRGPKINVTSYDPDLKSKLSIEPFIEHDRLTDLLRKADSDSKKAEILRDHLFDSLEISRVMTAYRDMKDDKGNYFLRKNYNWTDFVKNLPLIKRLSWPGPSGWVLIAFVASIIGIPIVGSCIDNAQSKQVNSLRS